jgi:cell division protein FtsI/penicillin-binding protein 2
MRRVYPRGTLAAQVLGLVGTEGDGLAGLEYSRNALLRGHSGRRRVVSDAIGQPVSITETSPEAPGASLALTLDANIQQRTEDVLGAVGRVFNPKDATAIVMDPRSGAILAAANWPQVNANDPGASPAAAMEDRTVGFAYEPGSTFKAVTISGALQEGLITPNTPINIPDQIHVADRTIHDDTEHAEETLTTSQILARSSNVGAIKIGAVGGRPLPEPPGRRIISSATAASLRHMLEGVLAPGGTASEVSIPGYQLAGKTGTASKIDPSTGEYSKTAYIASFIGFAPAADPRLLCAVVVDEPQSGSIYGGTVAAPAFGQIMSFALPYLGVPPG